MMKKIFLILFVLLIPAIVCYLLIDKKLYYYGKSTFKFYQPLPLKIKPQYWGYNMGNLGFVLVNDYDMTLIAPGSKYWKSDIVVDEIIKYAFTKEKVIALIEASDGEKYYIECLKNTDVHIKREIVINVLEEKRTIIGKDYKWIFIKNNDFNKKVIIRNYLGIVVVLSLLSIIYLVVRLKATNKKDNMV